MIINVIINNFVDSIHELCFHLSGALHALTGHLAHSVGDNRGGGLLLACTGFSSQSSQHLTLAQGQHQKGSGQDDNCQQNQIEDFGFDAANHEFLVLLHVAICSFSSQDAGTEFVAVFFWLNALSPNMYNSCILFYFADILNYNYI